jgi:hypothetical protein
MQNGSVGLMHIMVNFYFNHGCLSEFGSRRAGYQLYWQTVSVAVCRYLSVETAVFMD